MAFLKKKEGDGEPSGKRSMKASISELSTMIFGLALSIGDALFEIARTISRMPNEKAEARRVTGEASANQKI